MMLVIGRPVRAEKQDDNPQRESVEVRRTTVSIEQGHQKLAKREVDLVSRELQLTSTAVGGPIDEEQAQQQGIDTFA
jgi:hypothetical protein